MHVENQLHERLVFKTQFVQPLVPTIPFPSLQLPLFTKI